MSTLNSNRKPIMPCLCINIKCRWGVKNIHTAMFHNIFVSYCSSAFSHLRQQIVGHLILCLLLFLSLEHTAMFIQLARPMTKKIFQIWCFIHKILWILEAIKKHFSCFSYTLSSVTLFENSLKKLYKSAYFCWAVWCSQGVFWSHRATAGLTSLRQSQRLS